MHPMRQDLDEILLTEDQIRQRLDELASEIQRDYADKDLTLVAILTGSVMFIADLLRRLPMQLRLDYVGISSYRGQTRSAGVLIVTKALKLDVHDRDVLVVDDILDTGMTLVKVREMILKLQPRSLKFCTFLEKDVPHHENFRADYVAFRIPNKFVVGYGLDYRERYRNLPCVGTLKPALISSTDMKISVQFFSFLRQIAGCNELALELPEGATVADALAQLYAKFPRLKEAEKTTLIAVGVEFAKRTAKLRDGDVLSLMPPLQGGADDELLITDQPIDASRSRRRRKSPRRWRYRRVLGRRPRCGGSRSRFARWNTPLTGKWRNISFAS